MPRDATGTVSNRRSGWRLLQLWLLFLWEKRREKKGQEQTTGNLETANALREAHVGGIEPRIRPKEVQLLLKKKPANSQNPQPSCRRPRNPWVAIVANSEEAQAAGRSFYELGARVDIAKIAMNNANLAAKELRSAKLASPRPPTKPWRRKQTGHF